MPSYFALRGCSRCRHHHLTEEYRANAYSDGDSLDNAATRGEYLNVFLLRVELNLIAL